MQRNFLLHVIKNRKNGKRYGVIVAIGPDKIGWSKCAIRGTKDEEGNLTEPDIFDLNFGIETALARAGGCPDLATATVPGDFIRHIETMKKDADYKWGDARAKRK